jgi:hypothetical protein
VVVMAGVGGGGLRVGKGFGGGLVFVFLRVRVVLLGALSLDFREWTNIELS